mgnify:CR=1 FL=1
MYTQNTPVHVKLWHKDFWLMAVANLLLTVAVYIQIPLLPIWMIKDAGFSPDVVAVSLGIFGLGVLLAFFVPILCRSIAEILYVSDQFGYWSYVFAHFTTCSVGMYFR